MRVVVACIPQTGHLFPLLPLAEAMAAQGDDVVVASGSDARDAVQQRGLVFRESGPAFSEWYAALTARTRGTPGAGLRPDSVERYFLPRLFGEVGVALVVDDLMRVVADHRADLLVFDPVMFAAPLVAAKLGVQAIQHTVGPLYDDLTMDLVADAVSPIWREFGVDVPEHAGMFAGTTLAICPPSLDPASARHPRIELLRPAAVPKAETPLLPYAYPDPDRPLVYATLGTFSNNPDLFRLIIDVLMHEEINLLVTVGRDNDVESFGAVPVNVHIASYIPQEDLLPHCALAVHHAGAGTTFGILAHALPSVALPQSADNFTIGDRLAASGAAVTIPPASLSADVLRDAVRHALSERTYGESARRLAAEIAGMPGPEEVAARLRQSSRPVARTT